jgi:hypothetical protein|tara:strand:- start:535 stop:747 length:213 start_codon:yes stop_codon:yes gene_type:complete
MKALNLENGERVTLEFSLIESRISTQERIKYYTERLNGCSNVSEVNMYSDALKIQKDKLQSITNILNKLI